MVAVFLVAPPVAHADVTATFDSGQLDVESDGADAITIACVNDEVKVNGADPATVPPGPVLCAAVTDITVQGGPGENTIDLSGVAPPDFTALSEIYVYGDGGNDAIAGGEFSEDLDGGPDADTITGGDGNDAIDGDEGDDVSLNGGLGNDWVFGDVGADVVGGGEGADHLYGQDGGDWQYGDGGDDFVDADIGDLVLDGADGFDTLTLTGSTNGEILDADALSNEFETASIYGEGGNDTLLGLAGDDFLHGGEGADDLNGLAGHDFLYGGSGPFDDTLRGGDGDDVLNGGEGSDTLRAGGGSDYLDVYDGSSGADGEEGPDVYEVAFGTLGTVTISDTGSTGVDELYVWPCDGTQVSGNQAIRGAEVVNYAGIEQAPCGYVVAPQPPAPQPPAPQPPAPQPPAPKPKPKPKAVKKITICHNGRTKKVTKKQLQALRKKAAKAKKGAKPKIKMGACKKKPKKKR